MDSKNRFFITKKGKKEINFFQETTIVVKEHSRHNEYSMKKDV